MHEQYDAAYLGILQNEANIGKFLDTIFSFLYRKTDFYVVMHEKHGKMGFPPGVAAKIVKQTFQKYENLAKRQQQQAAQLQAAAAAVVPSASNTQEFTTAADESEIARSDTSDSHQVATQDNAVYTSAESCGSGDHNNTNTSQDSPQDVKQNDPQAVTVDVSQNASEVVAYNVSENDSPGAPLSSSCAGDTAEKSIPANDGKDDDELKKKQSVFQEHAESYNGAQRENYAWSQDIKDVDIQVEIPTYVVKSRDVRVNIQRKHVTVAYRGADGAWCTVVDGDLTWDINKEESMWTLVPHEHIHVNLQKIQERWWEALVVGEEPISVRNIDASRPMSDLDDEAQAKIDEMMYNQRQKQLGLPQSNEQKMHGMLKKAWDAEGSPFKGQPFDPSKLNISSDNTMSIGS